MEITEVRIKLMEDNKERLRAFCSVTFEDKFVVRDLKIIDGAKGLSVEMPSRKLTDRCFKCRTKNHLKAKFCNNCGGRLGDNRVFHDYNGQPKLHADIAHPTNNDCREMIESVIIKAYQEEKERSKQPCYACRHNNHFEVV